MGLDMYLNATKTLSPKKRKEKVYIDYFNTLNKADFEEDGSMYISEYWGNGKEIKAMLDQMPRLDGQVGEIMTIKFIDDLWLVKTEAGYWRKANQIHNWFVEHTQGGVDECQYTDLSIQQLEKLQLTIKECIGGIKKLPNYGQHYGQPLIDYNWKPSDKAIQQFNKLLPTQSGFFFGSTDYDKYYLLDLFETKKILKKVLSKASRDNWNFTYHSSW